MNKILSVIVPTYNMEKYLHKCLDSLIVSDENMNYLEVLVINDGSKDSSSQMAHEYEAKYPQTFKVIDKENGNYGSCINRGLAEATGKYIKVLDADDSYVTEAFDKFISYLQAKDVDLVINDYVTVDEYNYVTETYTFALPMDGDFTLQDIPTEMVEWLWHQSRTYKRSVLTSINYRQTEGMSYTDDEWDFMPIVAVNSIAYFPHIMYNYLLGREGQTYDLNVMKASFGQRMLMGKSMIKYFAKVECTCSKAPQRFMIEKLRKKLLTIYSFYLIKEYSCNGNEMLKEFDLYIKENSLYMYNILEQTKNRIGGKNFISVWRTSGYKCTLSLWLRQIKFKIHLMIGRKYRNLHMPDNIRRK